MSDSHESKPSTSVCRCDELVEACAKTCHEANRAYCLALGDDSQPAWDDAPEWQKESAIKGVLFHIDNPDANASASHESWLANKREDGWVYGPVKDPEAKTHPCIVPFEELPKEQQAKDFIFRGIVHGFTFDCPYHWTSQKQGTEGALLLLAAAKEEARSLLCTGGVGTVEGKNWVAVIAHGGNEAYAVKELAKVAKASFAEGGDEAKFIAALTASNVHGIRCGVSLDRNGWDFEDRLTGVAAQGVSGEHFVQLSTEALAVRNAQRAATEAAEAN
ncbi:MAG: RyR domain-containing protein [Desulfurivibrionaceae bacterium]